MSSFDKKWKTAAVLVVLWLLAVLAQLWFGKPEPVYQGKKFSYWFHEAEKMPEFKSFGVSAIHIRVLPAPAFEAMGTNAFPLLLKQIRTDDSHAMDFLRWLLPRVPPYVRQVLPNPPVPGSRQLVAANLLFWIGPPIRAFMPQLMEVYGGLYRRQNGMPPSTRIVWSEQFARPPAGNPPTGRSAAFIQTFMLQDQLLRVITEFGSDDPEIVPLMLSAFTQKLPVWLPKDYTNLLVAIRLSEPFLITNVSHPDPSVRLAVIGMLGSVASDHPEFTPIFVKAMDDTNLAVQRVALDSAGRTKPDFAAILPALDRVLQETNDMLRQSARMTLMQLGGGMKMFGRLDDALANPNAAVRAAAAHILGDYPKRAEIARPRLRELTNSEAEPDEAVRREAAATLARMAGSQNATN